jgi:hypothetical protein
VIKIESKGSIWTIDEDLKKYMRMPKHEQPREKPQWGDHRAGALQDFVWHEYEKWEIVQDKWLLIHHANGKVVTAPLASWEDYMIAREGDGV